MPKLSSGGLQLYFRLCSDHLSIEAIPTKPLSIDFVKLRDRKVAGYETLMWTPHFVVLKSGEGEEITVRRNGRMIVRKATSETEAKIIAAEVMSALLESP